MSSDLSKDPTLNSILDESRGMRDSSYYVGFRDAFTTGNKNPYAGDKEREGWDWDAYEMGWKDGRDHLRRNYGA